MNRTILASLAAAAMAGASCAAHAQAYPSKPIRMIVPIAAGSLTDVMGRALAQGVTPALGQPVVAENRAGANGTLGTAECARAAPDGYTVCMSDGNILTLNPFAYDKIPYDPLAFAPVIALTEIEVAMVVRAGLPASSVAEVLDHARAHPGQVTWGSAGAGSTMHLYLEWFQAKTGIRFNHIPYKGPAQLAAAIGAGEVDVTFISPSSVAPFTGKVRQVAVVVGKTRSKFAGATPTLAEQGFDLDFRNWLALVMPPGTPDAVVRRWNAEVNKLLADPAFVSKIMGTQSMIATGGTPEDLGAVLREKRKVGQELAKIANLKYD